MHLRRQGPSPPAERASVSAALEAVGASLYADRPVGVLSGGEQQRLLIAQALLTSPRIMLLDEPLASLDLRSSHDIVHLVDDLRRSRHMTVLFVAHDLNPLLEVLDGIIYIGSADARPRFGAVDDVFTAAWLGDVAALTANRGFLQGHDIGAERCVLLDDEPEPLVQVGAVADEPGPRASVQEVESDQTYRLRLALPHGHCQQETRDYDRSPEDRAGNDKIPKALSRRTGP